MPCSNALREERFAESGRTLNTLAHRTFLGVFHEGRSADKLDQPPLSSELVPVETVHRLYRQQVWLGGGEPTLRADFPQLLKGCDVPVSLRTDGLVLTDEKRVKQLVSWGLKRVCIPIHSIRPDAHDWLVGMPGAARGSLKAVRVCAEAGLEVHVELVPTRPTTGLLMETVGVLARLGVHTVVFRRLRLDWMNANDVLPIVPRLGLLEPYLKGAIDAGLRLGVRVQCVGFPRCAAPDARAVWLGEDVWIDGQGNPLAASVKQACCGAVSQGCEGVPLDYLGRFGSDEFRSEGGISASGTIRNTDPKGPVEKGDGFVPPGRSGRAPATRLREITTRVFTPGRGIDPAPGRRARPRRTQIRISVKAPHPTLAKPFNDSHSLEPSRDVRRRMVDAAQEGAQHLHLCSSGLMVHPDAAALLREATRLSFTRVSFAGELSPLVHWSEREVRRLRGIHRADAAVLGTSPEAHDQACGHPGAFEETLAGLARFADLAGGQTGLFAIIQTPEQIGPLLDWRERLPVPLGFRLAHAGGDLQLLATVVQKLSSEVPELQALLPCGLRNAAAPKSEVGLAAWGEESVWTGRPSAVDVHGAFEPCECGGVLCAGIPLGWHSGACS